MSSCRDEEDIRPILGSINASDSREFTSGSVPSLNQAELEELKGLVNHLDRTLTTLKHRLTNQHGVTFQSGTTPTSSESSGQISWWTKWSSSCIERITKHLLIITLLWQSLYVGILSLIDLAHPAENNDIFIAGIVVMITFQLVNLVLVVYTSVKLTQQLYEHKASASFLGQSYLSTVLLFAGLYTCIYRLEPKSWRDVHDDDALTPELVVVLFIKMFFFSMSTGTLCGASDIVPMEWYNYLVVCVQMLLSFVYFASIFTMASGVPNSPGPVIMDLQVDSVALTGELERAGRNRSLATSYAHEVTSSLFSGRQ
ncbi:Hypp5971 [Branchiostoma lanceolatum]|uniref:Hypp5971 protein n=1 Tax=Branchiostoma lanceolatum TaxID=7740 RepID=A0A8J9W5U2_BRALA|nr:Hypp5971 [Branchiostoma lanceolatum]